MTAFAYKSFANQVEMFSYAEQLSAMEIILNAMRRKERVKNRHKISLEELDALASKGGKCLPENIDAQDYVNSMRQDREF